MAKHLGFCRLRPPERRLRGGEDLEGFVDALWLADRGSVELPPISLQLSAESLPQTLGVSSWNSMSSSCVVLPFPTWRLATAGSTPIQSTSIHLFIE